jgi:DNA-binding IclR family transcriptional regulator
MVYVFTQDCSNRTLQALQRIGRIAPMHATGVGKIHLINYSDERLLELEEKYGFTRFTKNTITSLDLLKKEIVKIKKQGYALDNEECEEGVKCIAVPIINYSGQVTAAISLSSPAARLGRERTEEIIGYLKRLSVEASRELGGEGLTP